MDRRGFLKSIFVACAAPAFIKAENLMKCTGIIIPSAELSLPSQEIIASAGNVLATSSIVAREALRILKQNLALTSTLTRGWDDEFDTDEPSGILIRKSLRYDHGKTI